MTTQPRPSLMMIIIISIFVKRHKVVTSEALDIVDLRIRVRCQLLLFSIVFLLYAVPLTFLHC